MASPSYNPFAIASGKGRGAGPALPPGLPTMQQRVAALQASAAVSRPVPGSLATPKRARSASPTRPEPIERQWVPEGDFTFEVQNEVDLSRTGDYADRIETGNAVLELSRQIKGVNGRVYLITQLGKALRDHHVHDRDVEQPRVKVESPSFASYKSASMRLATSSRP